MTAHAPSTTDSMTRLVEEFARLPGIGRRTAEKLAYHLLTRPPDDALKLARAIEDVKRNISACSRCFNLTETDPCPLCQDPRRDGSKLCVVEQPKDLLALEKTGTYAGLYHVLTGRVAPLEGVGPESLTIRALAERIAASQETETPVREVILATNPDYEGDGTALYVREALAGLPVSITQLARGLPAGSSIEFSSGAILADALKDRRPVADAPGPESPDA